MANERINFYYDPKRQGYDTTLLKTLGGIPSSVGDVITLNKASFIAYADVFKEDLTLNVTIPAVPTAGDDRKWGLAQLNEGSLAIFAIEGAVFKCICSFKGVTTEIEIPWDPAWTATPVDFTIKWTGFSAEFLINGVQPDGANIGGTLTRTFINDVSVSKSAMSTYVDNENTDDMVISYMEDKNVQDYI